MGLLKLFNAIDTKQFYQSQLATDIYKLPFFASGDQDTIEYTLLTRNPDGGFFVPWKRENPSSYSLKIALLTAAGVSLATATVWTDDLTNNKKTGRLIQDASAITGALGSSLSIPCLFEVEVTDAAGNISTIAQEAVELKKGFITPGTVDVAPGEVGATQRWVNGLFMPWVWPADAKVEMVTPNGTRVLTYVGDDLQWHFEPLS